MLSVKGFVPATVTNGLLIKEFFTLSMLSESNGIPIAEITGPFLADSVASGCAGGLRLQEPVMWIVAYTLMALCALVLLILLALMVVPCRRRQREGEITDESSLVRNRIK